MHILRKLFFKSILYISIFFAEQIRSWVFWTGLTDPSGTQQWLWSTELPDNNRCSAVSIINSIINSRVFVEYQLGQSLKQILSKITLSFRVQNEKDFRKFGHFLHKKFFIWF